MNYLICGNLREDEIDAIKAVVVDQDFEIVNLKEALTIDFKPTEDDVYVFEALKLSFVSEDFFKFVNHLTDNKIFSVDFKVVLIEDFNQNGKIVIDWCRAIFDSFGVNLKVVAEIDRQTTGEELCLAVKTILASEKRKLLGEIKQAMQSAKVSPMNEKVEIKDSVVIYTDGACSGNPGAGGWGAVLIYGHNKKEISGFEEDTTNNRMELTAVIRALSLLKQKCNVELFSDSAYVVNAIKNNWLDNWKVNGWVGADKKPVKNIELWKELDSLLQTHNVNFNKVKGHSDNELNNRCDELATGEIKKHLNA